MENRKLTKEDIDKVRDIEGFPIATDEDIIALSNPPYYTACPNPFIEDFIKEHGKPYDEATDDYHREPFAADVNEDKHDLIYNIHGYHTKVPPKAIKKYIEHYTKPGDIVFDGFCGTGMTGVAAQICNDERIQSGDNLRKAILCDLSTYATFISSNYNNPNDNKVVRELEEIINDVQQEFGEYYTTFHNAGYNHLDIKGNQAKGYINYVVWSNVFYCPYCSFELIYYDVLVKNGIPTTNTSYKCPGCNAILEKNEMIPKYKDEYDADLNKITKSQSKVAVLINYSFNKKRFTKLPDKYDIAKLDDIKVKTKCFIPENEFIHGDETERLFRAGITHVKNLYPDRTLWFLSLFYDRLKSDNKKLFLFTSALPKLTVLNRYMPEHGSRALVGPRAGTYYLPPLYVENDVIGQLEFQLKKLNNLHYKKGNTLVSSQSTTDLSNILSNSIDYVFIDPPFGANIMYSELNYVAESWLKIFTQNKSEAIINKSQAKRVFEYQSLMTKCFSEINRILKPNRWMTVEFHNSKNSIWNSLQETISIAGFVIADVRILNKEKKTINQFTAQGCVDQDLVISAYKPKESFKRNFMAHVGSEQTVWEFIRQHLENLPVAVEKNSKIEVVVERQAFLLFDRMVAFHIVNGMAVPIDAADFYKGLDEKFMKRDGMYFLADQINEYDTARIKSDVEDIQFSLMVSNEKTAIAWLYQQLVKPQTYAEIMPKFMKEQRSVEKYEKLPELSVMLEENFLQNEDGKWYIPDFTKAADVIKLREKRLVKEFEEYLNTKGKLTLFRAEAVRAGFAKLWKDKNYALIVKTAERLPESVIQEDDKLLMYYDISLGRL